MENGYRWTGHEWRWLWHQLRPFARYEVGSVIAIVGANVVTLLAPLLMKWLLDDVLPQRRWSLVLIVAALFGVINIIRMVLVSAASLWSIQAICKCVTQMRVRLLTHLMELSPSYYDRASTGDLVERIERDTSFVSDLGSEILPTATNMIVQTLLTVAIMVYLDWRLTAIVVPLLAILAGVRHHYGPVLHANADTEREAGGRRGGMINEMLSAVAQIQMLGAERRLVRRYALLNLQHQRARVVQRVGEIMFGLQTMNAISVGSALVMAYGGIRVLQGSLTPGGLVAFYAYVGTIFMPLVTATDLHVRLIRVRACIRRLVDLEQARTDIRDAPDVAPLSHRPRLVVGTDVAFHYASDKAAVSGVDFDARAGERVAIVGASGCGKSSLLQLIPRLYDVEHGRVEIDGRDVRSIQLRSLRRAISFVPQHPALFRGTLRDNLQHGAPTASSDDLRRAIDVACLGRVIAKLSRGLDTELGSMGAGLSGGERQRVAIARAVLQDRPILILDEATSAIDEPTEHELLDRLETWSAGRVVLIVSHRPSAARWADRVLVFDRGRLVEDGTHEALYVPGTFYYDFWHRRGPAAAQNPHDGRLD
jgi:ABC-type multidrug transport system fused ATPase/permease subunit